MDESMKLLLLELEDLVDPIEDLSQEAKQCYEQRLNHDADALAAYLQYKGRETEKEANDVRLEAILKKASILEKQRATLTSHIPTRLLKNDSGKLHKTLDRAAENLEKDLLRIEQQRLAGVLAVINYADVQFASAQADLAGVRDPIARDELAAGLETLQLALQDFRHAYCFHGASRLTVINMKLIPENKDNRKDSAQKQEDPVDGSPDASDRHNTMESNSSNGSSTRHRRFPSSDDTTESRNPFAYPSPSSSPSVTHTAPLSNPSPSSTCSCTSCQYFTASPVSGPSFHSSPSSSSSSSSPHHTTFPPPTPSSPPDPSMFLFSASDPPSLSRLATWLGLTHAVDAAILLHSPGPLQAAFAKYGTARATEPKALRLTLPLFTYEKDTLLAWRARLSAEDDRRSAKPKSKSQGRRRGRYDDMDDIDVSKDKLDVDAALFAYHVVRYLERSCDEVGWAPVAGDLKSLEDYEVARRRWAVVLQVFWFLQKAFGSGKGN